MKAQGIFEAFNMAAKHVTAPADEWVDANELAGFTVGLFQNQTGYTIEAIESDVKPQPTDRGRWIYSGREAEIEEPSLGLWVRSAQPIYAYVQERKQ